MRLKSKITLVVVLLLAPGGLFIYLNAPPPLMQTDSLYIKEGDTVRSAAGRLKRQNLITSRDFFTALSVVTKHTGIRKGKYRIERGASSIGILIKLVKGDIVTAKVTLPEGFNLYSIATRLEEKKVADSGLFIFYASNTDFLRATGLSAPTAEGYLFPDTYILPEEADARDIIITMRKRADQVYSMIDFSPAGSAGMSEYDIIILASLIEKEARVAAERPAISSVFHNRLKRGMKLDCDPTVRYAARNFTGPILRSELLSDSPYNTYIRRGLPPTPICSPGKSAIEAALKPENTAYLYFVARNDGSHYFSKTLSEHNRAVAFYQKGIRNGFVDTQKH
jgi:UPF0755 protein